MRKTGSSGPVDFLYDLAGHVITELNASGGWNRGEIYAGNEHVATYANGTTYFTHADWLGSERVRSTIAAAVYSTWTSYPFGEGSASPNPGPTHFTGKERDSETGLDYFGARHYNSNMARFLSSDPFNIVLSAEDEHHFKTYISQPQNWNRYAYTWNNPLIYVDPNGERVYVVTYTEGNERGDDDFFRAAATRAQEIASSKDFNPQKDVVLLAGVKSEADFERIIGLANSLDKKFGKVGEVDLFSHSGDRDGPNFNYGHNKPGGPHYTNEQAPDRLSSLKINWDASSTRAGFYGCFSANFAQEFANRQGVSTWGFDNYAFPSSTPEGRSFGYIIGSPNVYWVTRDGRPPVRRDPQKPQ